MNLIGKLDFLTSPPPPSPPPPPLPVKSRYHLRRALPPPPVGGGGVKGEGGRERVRGEMKGKGLVLTPPWRRWREW